MNLCYLSLSSGNGLVRSFGCHFIYSGRVSKPFCIKKPRAYSTFVLRGSTGSLYKDERNETPPTPKHMGAFVSFQIPY